MSRRRLVSVLVHLRRTLGRSGAEGLPDAELLDRFVRLRDEAAFELLVWRHENMVIGVCRRLLRNEHDAEDAFQASFLTLSRKAGSIGRREAVASWLYQVAYRCALRMRQTLQRQRQAVVSGITSADVAVPDSGLAAVEDSDLRAIIDEEVARLPAKYRAAVVLCYLEGKSYQQAAKELGCPAGTLSTRLHVARERLRRRLTRRGVGSAAALAALEGTRQTHAAARLAAVAVQAAQRVSAGQSAADVVSSRTLEIATGVIQTMSASKQKTIVLVLLLGCMSGLTSWAALHVLPHVLSEQRAESADKPAAVIIDGKAMTWQECARLRNAVGRSRQAHFTPDGSALAALDGEGRLRVWNTSDWRLRWEYRCRDRYGNHFNYYSSFSPDGRLIDVDGKIADETEPGKLKAEITLLDAASGREVARLPGFRLVYSPDNTMIATFDHKDGVTLWDARTFRKLHKLDRSAPYVVFSKDGSLVVIGNQVWETATGKKRAQVEGFEPQFSPDGKRMLTVLSSGIVKLWDTADGRERAAIRKQGRKGCTAVFTADGKLLMVRSYLERTPGGSFPSLKPDRKPRQIERPRIQPVDVCLYDAATGAEVQQMPGQMQAGYDFVHAELSPDGRTVAYARLAADETKRQEVVLWDVRSGRERAVLQGASERDSQVQSGMHNPHFSPDGTMLYADHLIRKGPRLWDAATGRLLLDLPAEDDWVFFSSDGQWLAGVPSMMNKTTQDPCDIRVFHRSDKPLSPVIRGDAEKPSSPPPPAPTQPEPPKSEAARALDAVRKEAEKNERELRSKFGDGVKPGPEGGRLQREWTEARLRFGTTALKVARDFPADPAALEALEFVLRSAGGSAEGEMGKLRDEALAVVLRDHRRSPELSNLVFWVRYQNADSAEKALAEIAEGSPHRTIRGRAACQLAEALAEKAGIARLIQALPELLDDPELAGRSNRLKQLRVIDADAVARSAEEWYVKVRDQYADVLIYEGSKETLGQNAESGLFALRNLALGKVAPDIEGEDFEGKRFHLQDYRGKVVVLIFCGHWCGPCRQMNPQKQQLIERHAGKSFALLEVNSDDDPEAVRRIMRKEKLTWRCWFDGGREGPIARRWGVHSWPTIFILDGKGVIRYKELRGPMLDRVVDRLLKQ